VTFIPHGARYEELVKALQQKEVKLKDEIRR
jgi:hypothetical protein